MRKSTITILVGAVLGLGACTVEPTGGISTPADTRPPRTSVPPLPANPEDDYLAFVNSEALDAVYQTDEDLAMMGYLVCDALDNGNSVRSVAELMEQEATTDGDVELFAAILFAAVTHLCPEHESALNRYANG